MFLENVHVELTKVIMVLHLAKFSSRVTADIVGGQGDRDRGLRPFVAGSVSLHLYGSWAGLSHHLRKQHREPGKNFSIKPDKGSKGS